MKKTIILIFLLGIGIMAYSNDIRNISIQCIDRNGYTSSNLESTQINNLLIEFDYYNDNQYVSEDDIKISIASIGIGYDYFLEVTNIKYGSNHCSAKIKSLSSNIASNFPAGQYALTITSGMAGSKFRSFTISEMKSVANTNTYTNTNNSTSTSSSSYSRSNAEASVGAIIAIAGAGYLIAKLFSMSDNKSSSSSSSSYSNSNRSYSSSNISHSSSSSSYSSSNSSSSSSSESVSSRPCYTVLEKGTRIVYDAGNHAQEIKCSYCRIECSDGTKSDFVYIPHDIEIGVMRWTIEGGKWWFCFRDMGGSVTPDETGWRGEDLDELLKKKVCKCR